MNEAGNGLRWQVADLVRRTDKVEKQADELVRELPSLKQRVEGMQDILQEIRDDMRWQRRALQGLLFTVISGVGVVLFTTFMQGSP